MHPFSTTIRSASILLVCGLVLLTSCGTDNAVSASAVDSSQKTLTVDNFTYIQIDTSKAMWGEFDDPEWLRYFGLAMGDVDGDGDADIVSGRNVYLNPGGDMSEVWVKEDLGHNVDANLILGKGANSFILGESLPDVMRFRRGADGNYAQDVVAQVPPTGHHNGQGYRTADLTGDGKEEVIYASQGGLYVITPDDSQNWAVNLVAVDASDEGFAVADMDSDGDLDLVAGYRDQGGDAEVPTFVSWYENNGTLTTPWKRHEVGRTINATDRVEAADFNGDGRTDVAVSEERYPGLEPDANLWIFIQSDTGFVRKDVVTQYSMNNLHAVDIDRDGDVDLLTSEHKGKRLALQAWINDGKAGFSVSEIDKGKENHLGARAFDMDGDADLDILGIGWDQHKFVHLWRNDAIQ